MDHKTVEDYILSMPNAVREYPFGEEVAVYKVFVPSSSASHADGVQGAAEEAERTVQEGTESEHRKPVTQQSGSPEYIFSGVKSAASTGSVSGSARKQDGVVRGDWKMFALIQEGKEPVRISLRCDPQLSLVLRDNYDEVMEGYHLSKKHWNTIVLTGQLTWEEIQALIRHSYDLVVKGGAGTPEM